MHRTLLRLVLASVRLIRLTLHIGYAMGIACVYPRWEPPRQSRFRQHWSRGVLRLLNIHCATQLRQPDVGAAGGMLVANHLSSMLILDIKAALPQGKEWTELVCEVLQ